MDQGGTTPEPEPKSEIGSGAGGGRFTLPDTPRGVTSQNSALLVVEGENFLPAQA